MGGAFGAGEGAEALRLGVWELDWFVLVSGANHHALRSGIA